jgi:lambda repressor-like predicted transcriptional regulator
MHPEEIKAALRMAGTTPAMLATELEVSSATISVVIHGRAQSARIKARIAKVIGKPASAIWPDDGRPKLQRPKGSVPARKPARARA